MNISVIRDIIRYPFDSVSSKKKIILDDNYNNNKSTSVPDLLKLLNNTFVKKNGLSTISRNIFE